MSTTTHRFLTQDQVDSYWAHGYLHVPSVFTEEETAELSDEMNRLMSEWAKRSRGWTGAWRKKYMDTDTEKASKLVAMHDLQLYSAAWMRAVTHSRVAAIIADLLDGPVEFHHSTMHVKPPQTGHPFPMHQDYPFYEHENERYVDVLVHLDDTDHENGEIRFQDGSHTLGKLEHVTQSDDGTACSPFLPLDDYPLENTVAVPAKAGDLVLFNILTIHGSYINTTDRPRRLVRVGYRDPDNRQLAGQSLGRPGWMIAGGRPRREGQELFAQYEPTNR
jgi:ectoine hydroxylase-related dioxygenase (phytanoyl-CoA dioxygenase family)